MTDRTPHPGYKLISSMDFAENKQQLALSYLLRLFGAIVFTALFIWLSRLIHPELPAALEPFLTVSIPGIPEVVSLLLVILSVVLVLAMHELVHASVFYLDQRVPPHIGIRGPIIFAAAPGYMIKRLPMLINGLAPFTVISILGLALIALLPIAWLPWIFIPTVVNAAAAGGDFMMVVWILKLPGNAVFEDDGDVTRAYEPA